VRCAQNSPIDIAASHAIPATPAEAKGQYTVSYSRNRIIPTGSRNCCRAIGRQCAFKLAHWYRLDPRPAHHGKNDSDRFPSSGITVANAPRLHQTCVPKASGQYEAVDLARIACQVHLSEVTGSLHCERLSEQGASKTPLGGLPRTYYARKVAGGDRRNCPHSRQAPPAPCWHIQPKKLGV